MKVCNKCKIEKPLDQFNKASRRCKLCVSIDDKVIYQKKKLEFKELPSSKTCSRCNETKLSFYFHRKCTSPDGLRSACKDCISELNNHKRHSKEVAPLNLDPIMVGYLAGLIDGEGHISVIRSKRPKGNFFYCGKIVISQANKKLIDLRDQLNIGSICFVDKRKINHKDLYVWSFSPNECRALLPEVMPYLFFKKQQAMLLIEYLELAKHTNNSDEYRQKASTIHKELQGLNRRGRI